MRREDLHRRHGIVSRLFSNVATAMDSLGGFALMLAGTIPVLNAGGFVGGDQSTVFAAGMGGGAALLVAGQMRERIRVIVPLVVGAALLGSSSIGGRLRSFLLDRGITMPDIDLHQITASVDPTSLLLIYVGAGLGVAASVLTFLSRVSRRRQ